MYLRSKELSFSEDETSRLTTLLGKAPGPTPWHHVVYPDVPGPRGHLLKWKQTKIGEPVVLASPDDGTVFLALGFQCYVKAYSDNRLLEWHEQWGEAPEAIQLNLMDTGSLEPLAEEAVNDQWNKYRGYRSTHFFMAAGKPLARLSIPFSLSRGLNEFHFPEAMKACGELILLTSSISESMRGLRSGRRLPRAIYIADPSKDRIEAVKMDWWNDPAANDDGYVWISQLARDPVTKNLVGAGVRIAPFVLDGTTHEYLGMWSPNRYKTFIYTDPEGKERTGKLDEIRKWIDEDAARLGLSSSNQKPSDALMAKGFSIRPPGTPPTKQKRALIGITPDEV